MSFIHSHCVSAALGIQHAMHIRRNVICGLSESITFSTYLMKDTLPEKKNTQHKTCVLIFCTTFFSETFLIL